jgi:hypothetical protein
VQARLGDRPEDADREGLHLGRPVQGTRVDGVLDCGKVLPGFKLLLADLFEALKQRKKEPR